jgi:DnaJ-domain-containing protein 1
LSIPERLFNISKAYLNQVRDRIDHELSDAERELDAEGARSGDTASGGGSDADSMMRRAEERIAAARRDLESQTELARAREAAAANAPTIDSSAAGSAGGRPQARPATPTTNSGGDAGDPNYHDYRVLGVPVGSDLAAVQSEYEKLSRRCDPRRFPEGSAEQKQADQILGRINASYEALRRRLDPTENRFGKLELEE